MDIGPALIGGASAVIAMGLTVLMAWVFIGVTEYFLLEHRMTAEAKLTQNDVPEDGEEMESLTPDKVTLDDLINQYDRMEDE